MEFDDKKIIELFLGLIFVALLLVVSMLVLNHSGKQIVQNSIVVQDSYNVNYNYHPIQGDLIYSPMYRESEKTIYLKYSSYGEHKKSEGYFSNYKDEFNVYVVNKDYKGDYFKVKFYFCDYYDNCFSETVEKYISAKEERKFQYVEVQSQKYKFYDWEYDVIAPELD